MELPIQLKFFKKLELYQELLSENKKATFAGATRRELWNMEKEVLAWTDKNHHHRLSPLKNTDLQDKVERKFSKEYLDNELGEISRNLVSRGFAVFKEPDDESKGIIITPEGFLMGKVINDIEGQKIWVKIEYTLLYKLVWITALAGALIVIINLLVLLYKGLFKLFLAIIHY